MKRFLCLLAALLLTVGLMSSATVLAAGTANITANKSSVTVGQQVTVTAKYNGGGKGIGSLDARFEYNAKAFEYVSCSGATAHGGAGSLKISYYADGATAAQTATISITLKAIAPGNGDFKWETEGMYDDDDNLLGSPKQNLSVTASNPSLSGDATLKELRPTKGTLVPKFDKNVTEYTVSVPYTVTRGLLVFTPTDPNAQSVVTENADLKVGKNVRVITVTAPNGTTKKYTVTFTREPQQSTTGTGTDTTTTLPPATTPQVEVDGKLMDVCVTQPPINLPVGFVWDFTTLGDNEVSAAKQKNGNMTLVYLLDSEANTGALYIYDALEDSFTLFRQITDTQETFVLHDLPDSETAPVGTVVSTITIAEQTVSAYVYEDPDLADYAILYLTAGDGFAGYYSYDMANGTLQRYHAVTVQRDPVVVDPEPQIDNNPVQAFFKAYKETILVGAAGCVGIAILLIVIVWIASHSGGKGKH